MILPSLATISPTYSAFERPQFTLGGYNPHITVVAGEPRLGAGLVHKVHVGSATLFDIDAAGNRRSVLGTYLFTKPRGARS